jgi:hypothetical protein
MHGAGSGGAISRLFAEYLREGAHFSEGDFLRALQGWRDF